MSDPTIAARCWRQAAVVVTLTTALTAPAARAIQRDLGTADLQRAIKIGSGSDADRARIRAAYIFPLRSADPAIEQGVSFSALGSSIYSRAIGFATGHLVSEQQEFARDC